VKNIETAVVKNPSFNAVLMQRHGVVIYTKDYDEAFNLAQELETKAKALFDKVAVTKTLKQESKPYLDDYAQMFGYSKAGVDEDKEAIKQVRYKNSLAASYQTKLKPMKCLDVLIQHFVYKKKYAKLKNK